MFRFLRLLDLYLALVAIAIVNIFLTPVLLFVVFRCLHVHNMFGFPHLLDLFCALVAIATVNLFFAPVLFVFVFGCPKNVWTSTSSAFVWCVGGHSHRKSFLIRGSVLSCLGADRILT